MRYNFILILIPSIKQSVTLFKIYNKIILTNILEDYNMQHIVQLLGIAIIAFISTNIDDFFVLAAFFSDNSYNKKIVIIGQYIGITILILISCVGFIFKLLLPTQWIGIMGLLPIIIGIRHLINHVKNKKKSISNEIVVSEEIMEKNSEGQHETQTNVLRRIIDSKAFFIAIVTFSNGGDNIGVYTPLFASLNLNELIFTVIMFLIMVAVWCYIIIFFVNNKFTGIIFRKYGNVCFPYVLILLGIYIILKCNTLGLFIS